MVCKSCRVLLRADMLSNVNELNSVVAQYESDTQIQLEYCERGKRTREAKDRRTVKHHAWKAMKWNCPEGQPNQEQTIQDRYWGDERYREAMRNQGYDDDTIGEMDEQFQAILEYDDVKEEERVQIQMWQREGRDPTAAAAQLPKGRQKGFKGGWMGTGFREEEEVTKSGRWLVRDEVERTTSSGPQDWGDERYASEDQWTRARKYHHNALFRMPDPDSETRASDFEGYDRTWWSSAPSGSGGQWRWREHWQSR